MINKPSPTLEETLRLIRIVYTHGWFHHREQPVGVLEQAVDLIPDRQKLLDDGILSESTIIEGLGAAYRLCAEIYLRRKERQRAVSLAQKAVEVQPNNPLNNTLLERSTKLLDPNHPENLFSVAQSYVESRNSSKALKPLHQLLEIEPNKAENYTLLGRAYLDTNQAPKAVHYLKRATEQGRNHTMPYSLMAIAYARMGRTEKAGQIYFGLGLAAEHSKDYASAVTAFEQSYRFLPKNEDVRNQLARAYVENGSPLKAVELLQNLGDISMENVGHYIVLGRALVESGRSRDAVPIFESLFELSPEFDGYSTKIWLADAYERAGDKINAETQYMDLIKRIESIDQSARTKPNWEDIIRTSNQLVHLGKQEFLAVRDGYLAQAQQLGHNLNLSNLFSH